MIAVYPGSFDPVTIGHMDIIGRASQLVDELVVAVLENQSKEPFFTIQERIILLEKLTADYPNISVRAFSGLLADFTALNDIDIIIRGIRDASDLYNELPMAFANRSAKKGVETVLLPADSRYIYISSRMVREIWSFGGNIDHLTPAAVIEAMKSHGVNKSN